MGYQYSPCLKPSWYGNTMELYRLLSRYQLGCKFGHVYRLIFRVAGYFEPPQVDAWHSSYTQTMVYHGLVLVGKSLCWKPGVLLFFKKKTYVFTMNLMMFPHHFHLLAFWPARMRTTIRPWASAEVPLRGECEAREVVWWLPSGYDVTNIAMVKPWP